MTDSKNEPIRNIAPFGLRMQPELKARLQALAEKQGISLNELITSALERMYGGDDNTGVAVVNLPNYIMNALAMTDESGQFSTEYLILKVLQAIFPDPDGIDAIFNKQERIYSELWDLDSSNDFKLALSGVQNAVNDLVDTVNTEFKKETFARAKDFSKSIPSPERRSLPKDNPKRRSVRKPTD